ncbi:MAG: MFS transporter [Betaproteobacteria bacterium]
MLAHSKSRIRLLYRMHSSPIDWRSIVALNAVSGFAHIGQFGIPFVVLPLWLEQHGADSNQLSIFAASLWLGQLPGLACGPALNRLLGARAVVFMAFVLTALALGSLALESSPPLWAVGLGAGFALGVRWIGLEPWLYNIAPESARGRLIGLHETVVALAAIVAPAISGLVGMNGTGPLKIGIIFVALASLPLLVARKEPRATKEAPAASLSWRIPCETVFLLGVAVASFGGMTESSIIGLFPLFGLSHTLDVPEITSLLSTFGIGGLVLQYAIGWLADHRGMPFTGLCCCAGTAVAALLLTMHLELPLLHVIVFALGGFVTAYLTLAMIAGAKTEGGTMAGNISALSMIYTISAASGPLIAEGAIHAMGGNGLMATAMVFSVAMFVFIAWLAGRRRARQS